MSQGHGLSVRIGAARGLSPRDVDLTIVATLDQARRQRLQHPGAAVMVAGTTLPFRDDSIGSIEDRRARTSTEVAEDARALRAGGRLSVIAGSRGGQRFWRRRPRPILASEWSAWFLGAGFADIAQREVTAPVPALCTEGLVRKLPTAPA